jgi:hypothetical protein
MKKRILNALLLVSFLAVVYSGYIAARYVDYKCLNECTSEGYMYGYCWDVCSYNY